MPPLKLESVGFNLTKFTFWWDNFHLNSYCVVTVIEGELRIIMCDYTWIMN